MFERPKQKWNERSRLSNRPRTNLAEASFAPQFQDGFRDSRQSGETVGNDGIVELGQTDSMEVVAEVYQTDIAQIQQGTTGCDYQ
jgi:hypothetical protein